MRVKKPFLIACTFISCIFVLNCTSPDTHPFSIDIHEAKIFLVDDGFKFADIDENYPGEDMLGSRVFEYRADELEEWSKLKASVPTGVDPGYEYKMVAYALNFDMYYTTKEEQAFKKLGKQYKESEYYSKGPDYLPYLNSFLSIGEADDPNRPGNYYSITSYIKIEKMDRKNRIIKNCTLFGIFDKKFLFNRKDKVLISYYNGEKNDIVPFALDTSLLAELDARIAKKAALENIPKVLFEFNETANTFKIVDNKTKAEIAYKKLIWEGKEVFYIGYEEEESKGLTGATIYNPGIYLAFSEEEKPRQEEMTILGNKTIAIVKNGGTRIIVYRDRVRNDLICNYSLEDGVLSLWR
jgi:hypothetical protein